MAKSCVICGEEEAEGQLLLLRAPCGNHWVCHDDVGSFFERATENESLYPPKCCDQIFFLEEWEGYIPFEVAWAFQLKEQGEYAVLPKFRVYCANTSCASFLHSNNHITDEDTKITYAICEADNCGKITCVSCKGLIECGTPDHTCKINENEKKFKETAKEQGYQECYICGSTVELTEACNHITCECGNNFCYICGKEWNGLHGCPQYGPAQYDEEGYNQEGYHRDTGLNRDGLTYRQQINRNNEPERDEEEGENDNEDREAEEEEDREEDRPDWDVLQHLGQEEREAIEAFPAELREETLDMIRVELFEEHGILFNQGHDNAAHNEEHNDEHNDEPENMEVDQDPEEGNEENQGNDPDGDQEMGPAQNDFPNDQGVIDGVIAEFEQFDVGHRPGGNEPTGNQGFGRNDEPASNAAPAW